MRSKESILREIAEISNVPLYKLSCTEGCSSNTQNRWIKIAIDGSSEEVENVTNAILHVIPKRCRIQIGHIDENERLVYINEPY